MTWEQHVISVEALRSHTGPVVIADCRYDLTDPSAGHARYAEGHIPGAFHLDISTALSGPLGAHGGRHPLPSAADFQAVMRRCGVDEDSLVVAYDAAAPAFAARLWWLLRYFGHARVRVLDGGFRAWQEAGHPVSQSVPAAGQGNFVARPQPGMLVSREEVLAIARQGGARLVDSRDRPRYLGDVEPIDPVAGCIPGACNLPWQGIADGNGRLLPVAKQVERWSGVGGPGEDLVVYCGSGVTACANLLSLAIAGGQARLYAGSWSDWCSYPDAPVQVGGA